jgi:hypothetical protein
MSNPRLLLAASVTAFTVLLAVAVTLLPVGASPAGAGTSATDSKALFQAGWERVGVNVCRCPVTTGDCVCELTK